jgi:hypothetical protein
MHFVFPSLLNFAFAYFFVVVWWQWVDALGFILEAASTMSGRMK